MSKIKNQPKPRNTPAYYKKRKEPQDIKYPIDSKEFLEFVQKNNLNFREQFRLFVIRYGVQGSRGSNAADYNIGYEGEDGWMHVKWSGQNHGFKGALEDIADSFNSTHHKIRRPVKMLEWWVHSQ